MKICIKICMKICIKICMKICMNICMYGLWVSSDDLGLRSAPSPRKHFSQKTVYLRDSIISPAVAVKGHPAHSILLFPLLGSEHTDWYPPSVFSFVLRGVSPVASSTTVAATGLLTVQLAVVSLQFQFGVDFSCCLICWINSFYTRKKYPTSSSSQLAPDMSVQF